MALKQCPDCNGKVSSNAKTCPHCGNPMTFGRKGLEDAKDTAGAAWGCMWVVLAMVLFVGMCSAVIGK